MTRAEVEQWIADNNGTCREWINETAGAHKGTYTFNTIDYLFVEMPDKWIAVFEYENGEYTPCIQAADLGHAKTWCIMREPINVPAIIYTA